MKADELMIGDWVKFGKEYFQVDGYFRITNTLVLRYNGHTVPSNHGCVVVEDTEPIPLTEEILKANGAYESKDGRSIVIDYYYIGLKNEVELCRYKNVFELSILTCVDMTGEPNEVYDLPPVKYVHELQHALHLCGLSELADNFKVE